MQKATNTNLNIRAKEVHLIDETGQSQGVISRDQALWLAHQRGYDLVEVSSSVFPPICRLLDYGKYKYKIEKEERKGKSKKLELKEVRLKLSIEPHDLEVKKNKIKQFLEKGHQAKVTVMLKGREMAFQGRAYEFIKTFKNELGDGVIQEGEIKRMGNRFSTIVYKSRKGSK